MSNTIDDFSKSNQLEPNDNRVIIIVGPTGSGKSKLAIDLALKLNGEIISADSKQNYKYLNIASAKVSLEEQNLIPHHLISFVDYNGTYSSLNFSVDALNCIKDIQDRGKIPIIAGGTFYYIEALLFENLLIPEDAEINCTGSENAETNSLSRSNLTSIYDELCQVDPLTAKKLHPNNIRKIKRALEVFKKTGKSWTEQVSEPRECKLPAIFFSLDVSQNILDSRLHKRVFDMVDLGLVSEVIQIHEMLKSLPNYLRILSEELELKGLDCKRNVGIIDSIGFMEFIPLFKFFHNVNLDSLKEIELLKTDKFKKYCDYFDTTCKFGLFKECIQNIIFNSIKYSKRQQRWINSRLSQFSNFFTLNSSSLESWDELVLTPAIIRSEEFLSRKDIKNETIVKDNAWEKFNCEICNRTLNGKNEWNVHLKSKSHKSRRKFINARQYK